jgi:hypothetical protein
MEGGRPARCKKGVAPGAEGGAGGGHVIHQDGDQPGPGWGGGVKGASEIAWPRLPGQAALGGGGAVAAQGRQLG